MSERRPTILLADDHPMLLEGLRKLLEPDFDVVGAVADGRQLLESAARLKPDLVVTDISMAGLDGIEATRRLQAALPQVKVLVLSFHAEASWVRVAFEAGARAYLTKTSAPEEIGFAVREVLDGRFFISSVVTRGVVLAAEEMPAAEIYYEPPRKAPPAAGPPAEEPLTPREADVVRLVGLGLGNKDIADRLGVSVTTVRTHLNRVYDKLKPASRVELALFASHTTGAAL